MSKENWKKTGKELGGAFEGLAKSVIRSVAVGVNKAEEWAEKDETQTSKTAPESGAESNVFNDGTWRETGKNLGHAMRDLGKTLLNTATGDPQSKQTSEQDASKDE